MTDHLKKPVLVVGGGIGGIQAAHDLAEMGIPVYLVEKGPSIGGRMAQLDKTFPTNDCSACILAPKVTDTYNHPLVYTMTLSDLLELRGEAPDLTAVIRRRPRFIDEAKCTGCGECTQTCPVVRKNEFDMNLSERRAIYKPFAQAVPNKVSIDPEACVRCGKCAQTCRTGAVCYDMEEEIVELPVCGAVLCPGYSLVKQIPAELGYHRYDEVVTALEYERILSASGPFEGHVRRPGDGRVPKRIAFLQCVGSRDHACHADYCSAVCCMYAVKEAQITREHLPEVEDIDIYYMDMRAHGKDFERYVENGREKYGISFIRGKVSSIEKDGNGDLVISASSPSGERTQASYDLAVLSTGFSANEDTVKMCGRIGVATDRYGFIACDPFEAPATSRRGVFACGAAAGPKDIPDTVTEASAAAAAAARLAQGTLLDEEQRDAYFPPEEKILPRDVSSEPVRMGVFVCHCGVNIAGYVDVKAVCAEVEKIPQVVHVEDILYACSADAQNAMIETIRAYGLNRVVVASCTPRTHEPLFQGVLAKTGLNPYLFTMANIRDQCSWVHMDDREAATQKAIELVRMAVGKGLSASQLTRESIPVTSQALVIGGGVAGLSAALAIAGCGHPVHLVEKGKQLGGNARRLNALYNGRPIGLHVERMIAEAVRDPLIHIYTDTVIDELDGYVGNFHTKLRTKELVTEVEHGVVVVAAGAGERRPTEYLYGEDPRVVTQLELDEMLRERDPRLNNVKQVVMIQCVGSREGENMYCSRVCCSQAIRNGAALRQRDSDTRVTILAREVRSYGLQENDYRDARRKGVAFLRYDLEHKPVVTAGEMPDADVSARSPEDLPVEDLPALTAEEKPQRMERGQSADGDLTAAAARADSEGIRSGAKPPLQVDVIDANTGEPMRLDADLLVLAAGIAPDREANRELAQMLKVPMTQDGFFLEAHAKLRPVDFATEGVFVCGLAHSPRSLRESVVQGRAAAGRAVTVLAQDSLQAAGTIAKVNPLLCSACCTCEQVCAYGAITVQEVTQRGKSRMLAVVNNVLCKGCGTCAANCRCGAIDVGGFSDRQIVNEIEYLLRLPKEMSV